MADEKLIKDAQFRKGLSIAYFNSLNASIELAKVMFPDMVGVDAKAFIAEWRDWFLSEHAKYYSEVISKVGVNYNPKTTIEKLNATKNKVELNDVWISLSADERKDDEIRKVAIDLKKKYESL